MIRFNFTRDLAWYYRENLYAELKGKYNVVLIIRFKDKFVLFFRKIYCSHVDLT